VQKQPQKIVSTFKEINETVESKIKSHSARDKNVPVENDAVSLEVLKNDFVYKRRDESEI
jgi:hypothetical protein